MSTVRPLPNPPAVPPRGIVVDFPQLPPKPSGLREFYAGLAMQAIISRDGTYTPISTARSAMEHADALLAELRKEPRHD